MAGTILVECALFGAGIWLYVGMTRARNRVGALALWGMVALLIIIYASALFGPLPPSAQAIAVAGLASWLFVLWAWRIDRNEC